MSRPPAWLRAAGELVGVALFGLALFGCAVLVMIGGPVALIGTAVALLLAYGLAWAGLRWTSAWRTSRARLRFDAWLVAAVLAGGATLAAVTGRWPIRGERWDAHGAGGNGGEANVLFFPWLHALLWIALVLVLPRWRAPRS